MGIPSDSDFRLDALESLEVEAGPQVIVAAVEHERG
jgi:hypothetical protein